MPSDILLDPVTYELITKDGDLICGESTTQHQALILATSPGEWPPVPWLGVGINNWINDDADLLGLTGNIQKQFELDGMKVNTIKGNDFSNLQIDAEYPD